jgi:hypothetical protein
VSDATPGDTTPRDALYERKARVLVRDNFEVDDDDLTSFPLAGGAAVLAADPNRIWLYLADSPDRSLGRALALAAQRGADEVDLLVDDGGGVLARRGALLSPPVSVWRIVERALEPVEPAPLPIPMPPPAGSDELVEMLRDAGAEVVAEHGVIHGEIRGLEVARVRVGDDGAPVLDVGVGRFDQEATALLHGHLPTPDALRRAVDQIRAHRSPGAAPHPVNRLARDRWLRAQLVDRPSLVGAESLAPVDPPEPRRNVKDAVPAAAVGRDLAGGRVLVVASVGVDLDLVPFAADLVAREHADRVVLATPARDQVPSQRALATRLPVPVELVAVEGDWPS